MTRGRVSICAVRLLWVVLGVFAVVSGAGGQPSNRPIRVGVLHQNPAAVVRPYFESLRAGLRDLGYEEPGTVVFEHAYGEGHADRLPSLASSLVGRGVNVIVCGSTQACLAAKGAAAKVPIVMAHVGDPVGSGFVASLSRPGGSVTGVAANLEEFSAKYPEFLREVLPRISRVGVLSDHGNPGHAISWRVLERSARSLRMQLHAVDARDAAALSAAFAALTAARVEGLIVPLQPFTFQHSARIVELATRHRLPTIFGARESVIQGGLLSYGPNIFDSWRRAAMFVDKLAKGADPGSLPVEEPTKFDVVINVKTAKALGLTIPPSLMARATEVVQEGRSP